jgi:hypothetical protein
VAADKEEIIAKVQEKAKDKKINCATALNLANELGVPPKVIGDACNELGIKIHNCQLGCF